MSTHSLASKFRTDLKFKVVWVDANFNSFIFCKTKPAPKQTHKAKQKQLEIKP